MRRFFSGIRGMALLVPVSFLLAGCITQPDGTKKLDPWNAAKKSDQKIEEWWERQ